MRLRIQKIGQVAKVLNVRYVGRNKLFEILRNKNVLDRKNQPYQKYVDLGYFRVVETSFSLPDGTQKINLKTVVFQKGVDFIRNIVKEAYKIIQRVQCVRRHSTSENC